MKIPLGDRSSLMLILVKSSEVTEMSELIRMIVGSLMSHTTDHMY